MQKRRSLSDAIHLTPEQQAFIDGQSDSVPTTKPRATPASAPADDRRSQRIPASGSPPEDGKPNRTGPRKATSRTPRRPARGHPRASTTVTSRLEVKTAEALRRASLERKLENEEPATTQGILEAALRDWLRKHDYLE